MWILLRLRRELTLVGQDRESCQAWPGPLRGFGVPPAEISKRGHHPWNGAPRGSVLVEASKEGAGGEAPYFNPVGGLGVQEAPPPESLEAIDFWCFKTPLNRV